MMEAGTTPRDQDALKLVLESIANENAASRGLVGQLLLEKFEQARHASTRRICAIEIFCKLMETVEDFGAFCVMWTKTAAGGDPLAAYLSTDTPAILDFYAKCLTDLPLDILQQIISLDSPDELQAAGYISTPEERAAYDWFFNHEVRGWRQTFRTTAMLYSRIGEESGKVRPADALNMFFNAKHGRKVLLPKGDVAAKLALNEEEVAIITPNHGRYVSAAPGSKAEHWMIMSFRLTPELVHKLRADTERIGDKLADLARMRLGLMENPDKLRSGLRDMLPTIIAMANKTVPPDAPCPCTNGKAFKDCHGRTD